MSLKTCSCIILLLFIFLFQLSAQQLFSYGAHSVSRDEFLKAYNKNNTETAPTDTSYRNYLELYARFKMKVQAALDARMDTLESQRSEVQSFRNQLAEAYIKDDATIELLVDEAMKRSLKDIHINHIFIPLKSNSSPEDTSAARTRINEAYEQLKKGEAFENVAARYNATVDSAGNTELGFVTVFVLPYELETLAYSLTPGNYSLPFRSKAGFHIFKNTRERKAAGKLRVAQILLAFSPGISESAKTLIGKRADSVYSALKAGADFNKLVKQLSDDNLTYMTGGEMPAFEVGHYDPVFEKAAFDLVKDGDISRPVKTSFGYHIIKRLQRIPIVADSTGKEWREVVKERVQQTDRMQVAREMLLKKIRQIADYREINFNSEALSKLTDSVIENRPLSGFADLNLNSGLFATGRDIYKLKDFFNYLESIRGSQGFTAETNKATLLDEYKRTTLLEFYRNHLDEYNSDFAGQLKEFKEGNLLFEIMQQKVWDSAAADSAGLEKYYTDHRNRYWWETSADAIIITSPDIKAAEEVQALLKKDPVNWRAYADSGKMILQADSGRFELSQLPFVDRTNFSEGLFTAGVTNEQDSSITFSYIIRLHKEKEQKKFQDAKGAVINDYQNYLEEKWIAELKKRYPVKINKKLLKKLPKITPIPLQRSI